MPVLESRLSEDIRLKYRFLDLRRGNAQKYNFKIKISFIRSEMLKLGFLEFQTQF